jgi:hypothetical protein
VQNGAGRRAALSSFPIASVLLGQKKTILSPRHSADAVSGKRTGLRPDYMLANILRETKESFHMEERYTLSLHRRSAYFSRNTLPFNDAHQSPMSGQHLF